MKSLLSIFNEITYRQGGRTGAFSFNDDEIDELVKLAKDKFNRIQKTKTFLFLKMSNRTVEEFGKEADPESIIMKITSPITGLKIPIKFIFVYEPDENVAGKAYKTHIEINVGFNKKSISLDEEAAKNIITHELTHFFDKQEWKMTQKRRGKEITIPYYEQRHEKKAYLDEMIQATLRRVKKMIPKSRAGWIFYGEGFLDTFSYPDKIAVFMYKNDYWFRDRYNKYSEDKEFMKKFYRSLYDISQNIKNNIPNEFKEKEVKYVPIKGSNSNKRLEYERELKKAQSKLPG